MMERRCAWCGKTIGHKKGKGVTHGICKDCVKKIEKEEKK